MTDVADQLPDNLASAHAMILAERAARLAAQAEAASAKAFASHSEALIARLKLEIEKVRRELYGTRSERKARLLEQMELQLEELEADASQDELAAGMAAKSSTIKAFERKRPSRKPFPVHLPRERVVIAAPVKCPCCGSSRLAKLGEDIAETLGTPENTGALVAGVTPESPAARAGIEAGDVILKFDGKDVSSMRGLPRIVADQLFILLAAGSNVGKFGIDRVLLPLLHSQLGGLINYRRTPETR